MKSAVVFVLRPGKNAYRADVISYEFTLEAQLSKGTVEVNLLDRKKRQLLKIGRAHV